MKKKIANTRYLHKFLEERKNNPKKIEYEPIDKDYLIGYLIGELIWETVLPTISTDGVKSRKVIEVTEEESNLERTISDKWFKEYNKKEVDKIKGEEYWKELQVLRRHLEDKYLPKEVSYHTFVNIEVNEMVLKGMGQALWDCDGCHYSTDTKDITITKNDFFTTIKLIYKP